MDLRDAVGILQGVTGLRTPTGRERLLGDVSPQNTEARVIRGRWTLGDGELTLEDVTFLLRMSLGLAPIRDLGPVVYDVAGSGSITVQEPSNILKKNPKLLDDGNAFEIALFDPYDIAIAPQGDVFFTEYYTGRVRVLKPDGTVRTLAGGITPGYLDGPGNRARFNRPMGLALLPNGNIVVADTYNHVIRIVTPSGHVSTLAGSGRPGSGDGIGARTSFYQPNGVATDPSGNVYVADTANHLIRKITPQGGVTTIAGDGTPGHRDGFGEEARLNYPSGVLFDPRDGGLFIADMANQMIRKQSKSSYVVSLAGNGKAGTTDDYGYNAQFTAPYGVDLDSQGRLWIADWKNGLVRVMHPDSKVETVAGVAPDGAYREGPALIARFTGLMNVRIAPDWLIYLADTDNQRIRVLAP
ncbi:MAG: SMP-30/gluconolactonase/LRE family protein [Armatimonadetes bacterium]|nr:SMP-30/gluconolactonase/LRE family protein [Armatimonadota bacterium]